MRYIATLFAMLLTVGSMAQVNKRSDTFIQQDVGLDVTTLMAVPKTDNISGLSGYSGAPLYFNPTNKRLHAHDGTSWIPFAQYNEVVRTDGAQTINGIKNFTSPVYGPQAVADGQYVTREQVLPLATQGTGIVRLLDAPISDLKSPSSATGLFNVGTSSTPYSVTIPAGTFGTEGWMLRLKLNTNLGHQATSTNRRIGLAVEIVQSTATYSVYLFDDNTVSLTSGKDQYLQSEFILLGSGNQSIAHSSVNSSLADKGVSLTSRNYKRYEAVSGINFTQAFSIRLRLFRTAFGDLDASITPLTVEVSSISQPPLPDPM